MTIEGLLKKCISEEVPCGFFLRTVIVNRGNSCELKPKKNLLVLRQWADLFYFLKTTHLSVIVFSHSFLVILISKKTSAYIIFQKLKNIDYSYIVLKTLNNINLNNFSLVDPCCEINFGKKSLKIARSFCAKVF